MNLSTIDENSEYVAIPIELNTKPPIPYRKESDDMLFDIEANDRWAGLKHGGICLLMLVVLGLAIYIYWRECLANK